MNTKRRSEIKKIIEMLEEAQKKISLFRDEEEGAFNNLPETLQETDKGENMQSACEALELAEDSFDEVISNLEEAINY